MPDNPRSLAEIVRAMHKPLSFAAKNNFANLNTIKGLDIVVPALARQTAEQPCPETVRQSMLDLAESFGTFYSLDHQEQQKLILKSLEIITNIEYLEEIPHTKHEVTADSSRMHVSLQQLARPVRDVPGVGPKTAEALERLNARTFEDLLYLLPRTYIDRRTIVPIDRIEPGTHAVVIGHIHGSPVLKSTGRLRLLEILIHDGSAVMAAKWFKLSPRYAALLKKKYPDGSRVMVTGQATRFGFRLEMHHPEIELLDPDEDPRALLSITPLYPLTEGLTQKTVQRVMQALTRHIPDMVCDYLPQRIRSRFKLVALQDAFIHAHQPHAEDDLDRLNAGYLTLPSPHRV